MMRKFFYLLSDRKSTREISYDEYREIVNRDYNDPNRQFMLAILFDNDLYIYKGKCGISVPLKQLKEILGVE